MTRLPIFPEPGFDQSAMTPVLVGVLLSWFFTETFGWVFAGLVVPGYLAAVFLLHPMGGVIDLIEAVLTYGVARLLGEHLPKLGFTSRIFGRERFFLIVVCSIAVRVVVEGMLLPALLPRTPWAFSIGLVVVPLAANACWKTGLRVGAVQTAVPTLLVYLVLRFVLVRYTNFSLTGFELATENVIASFLSSPKAYILILTGAAIASAANVRYGWDFNGILVPALLGLVVIEPMKLLATFAEAAVVLAIGLLAMRKISLVGPRQTTFFFAVDYVLRFAFTWIVGRAFPSSDPVGLTGFGYLLPTLLAVKMAQRDSVALVALPALKTSAVAFVLGTVIGYAATKIDPAPAAVPLPAPFDSAPAARPPSNVTDAVLWTAALGRVEHRRRLAPEIPWNQIAEARGKSDFAARAGLTVDALDGAGTLVRERGGRGLPALVVGRLPARERIILVLPDGSRNAEAALVAGHLVESGQASAVVIGQLPILEGRDPELERAAIALGRTDGVLIDLQRTAAGGVRAIPRATGAGSVVRRLLAPLGEISDVGTGIDLRPDAVSVLAGPAEAALDLGGATAVSALLQHVPGSGQEPAREDLVVLRRVLSTVMAARAAEGTALSVGRRTVRALGYRLSPPVPGIAGERTVALFGDASPRPFVLIVRTDAPVRRVIEAPRALERGTRDLVLRLATESQADAVLFGIEAGGSTYERDAIRAIHGVLCETANEVVVVRHDDEDRAGVAGVSGWGKDRAPLQKKIEAALASIAVSTRAEPLDARLREVASRTLPSGAVLVAVAADAKAEAAAFLGRQRDDMRALSRIALPVREEAVEGAAEQLARSLPKRPAMTLAPFVTAMRAGIGERSVTALGAMEAELASSAAAAMLVSDRTADVVLVVARDPGGLVVLVQPTSAPVRSWTEARSSTAGGCARAVIGGGACRVEGT